MRITIITLLIMINIKLDEFPTTISYCLFISSRIPFNYLTSPCYPLIAHCSFQSSRVYKKATSGKISHQFAINNQHFVYTLSYFFRCQLAKPLKNWKKNPSWAAFSSEWLKRIKYGAFFIEKQLFSWVTTDWRKRYFNQEVFSVLPRDNERRMLWTPAVKRVVSLPLRA